MCCVLRYPFQKSDFDSKSWILHISSVICKSHTFWILTLSPDLMISVWSNKWWVKLPTRWPVAIFKVSNNGFVVQFHPNNPRSTWVNTIKPILDPPPAAQQRFSGPCGGQAHCLFEQIEVPTSAIWGCQWKQGWSDLARVPTSYQLSNQMGEIHNPCWKIHDRMELSPMMKKTMGHGSTWRVNELVPSSGVYIAWIFIAFWIFRWYSFEPWLRCRA